MVLPTGIPTVMLKKERKPCTDFYSVMVDGLLEPMPAALVLAVMGQHDDPVTVIMLTGTM
jgi:hypothetical protein